jgi:AcrR family transcriptional regulator
MAESTALRGDRGLTERGRVARDRLLRAAEVVFTEVGYDGASVAAITRAAGVGLGSFYLYFPSKQEVFGALVDSFASRVRTQLARVAAELPAGATRAVIEREALRGFFELLLENPGLHRVLRDAERIAPEAHERYFASFRAAYVRAFRRLTPQAHEGLDVETLAWVMLGLAEILALRWTVWEGRMPTDAELDSLTDILARGVDS